MLNELIITMQLSLRELQTAGVVTAGNVTLPESWLVFATLFRFVHEIPIKPISVIRSEKLCVLYLDQGQTRKILDENSNPVTVFGALPSCPLLCHLSSTGSALCFLFL